MEKGNMGWLWDWKNGEGKRDMIIKVRVCFMKLIGCLEEGMNDVFCCGFGISWCNREKTRIFFF